MDHVPNNEDGEGRITRTRTYLNEMEKMSLNYSHLLWWLLGWKRMEWRGQDENNLWELERWKDLGRKLIKRTWGGSRVSKVSISTDFFFSLSFLSGEWRSLLSKDCHKYVTKREMRPKVGTLLVWLTENYLWKAQYAEFGAIFLSGSWEQYRADQRFHKDS